MLKHLTLGKEALLPRKGRDEHGSNGFGDAHSSEEWAAFDRALHSGLDRFKPIPSFNVVHKS